MWTRCRFTNGQNSKVVPSARLTTPSPIPYPQPMKTLAALFFAVLSSAAPKVEIGTINGAAFRIDVPENWNGGLVVYCHGYNATPVTFADQKLSPALKP